MTFGPSSSLGALGMTFGPVLVRPMLAHGKTREEILQVASELCALGCGDRGYEELLYGLFKQENTSDAIAVLREMHQLVCMSVCLSICLYVCVFMTYI